MVSDIDAIFRRFDTDDDMALSYSEFIEAVMPLRGGVK